MANIVAIVGRPNVGKSTLFNRLVEQKKAIMDDESGVTRDRHYGYGEWCGKYFTVIDTGGYIEGSDDIFEKAVRTQVVEAVNQASVILFMVDAIAGLTDYDKDIAKLLRESSKPVLLVPNKADSLEKMYAASEFYALGWGEMYPISSATGSGTGELLDDMIGYFEEVGNENPEAGIPRIAILGRPNVGKSSFLNVLLNEERSIVTDIAGTTRDSIDTRFNKFGNDFIITDTAGIRRKNRIKEDIEFYSVVRAIKALENSDVCVVLLDAENGLESQDVNIINLAIRQSKGVLIMVNKWDLVSKETKTAPDYEKHIQSRLGDMNFIPIIFTSVIKKQRVLKALEKATQIYENLHRRIPTSDLNNALLPAIEQYQPPAVKGKYIKIKYVTQLHARTPSFAFFCNHPQYIKNPYMRYLENKIRQNFDFEGVPINIFFRKK